MTLSAEQLSVLESKRGKIVSKKGGWRIGKAVYNHGFSMMDDLVGNVSYFQLVLLNVTGRLPSVELAQWIEASYICMSWPDPRIWCNYIGALAGSADTSPISGALAGSLAADSNMYGPGSLPNCMRVITSAAKQLTPDSSEQQFKQFIASYIPAKSHDNKPVLPGYARPIARGDERVVAMRKVSRQLNFDKGPHELLSEKLEYFLQKHYQESLNIGGYSAAFFADQGLSIKDIYRLTCTRVTAGVQACFAEANDNSPGTFLPMQCDDIDYQGPAPRAIPE